MASAATSALAATSSDISSTKKQKIKQKSTGKSYFNSLKLKQVYFLSKSFVNHFYIYFALRSDITTVYDVILIFKKTRSLKFNLLSEMGLFSLTAQLMRFKLIKTIGSV